MRLLESELIIDVIFIILIFTSYDYYYGMNYWLILFGLISIIGAVIRIVPGLIFKNNIQIASIFR